MGLHWAACVSVRGRGITQVVIKLGGHGGVGLGGVIPEVVW